MKKFILFLLSILFLFNYSNISKAEELLQISELLKTNDLLIIGEKFGRFETIDFISKVVDEFTKDGNCLKITLELSEDQQEKIDKSKDNPIQLNLLEVRGAYDREHYIELIENFNELIKKDRCIKLYTVGPPRTVPVEASGWMKKKLIKLFDSVPTLLIVSLEDALKYFKWDAAGKGTPFLAERLRIDGYKVASLLNYWTDTGCLKERVDTVSSTSLVTDWYLNELIYSEVQFLPKKASSVTDGINIWRCDSIQTKEPIEVSEKDIKKALRQGIPIVGMSREQVIKTVGEPSKKVEITDVAETWDIECSHDDGFDFKCYTITFENDKAVKVKEY